MSGDNGLHKSKGLRVCLQSSIKQRLQSLRHGNDNVGGKNRYLLTFEFIHYYKAKIHNDVSQKYHRDKRSCDYHIHMVPTLPDV